MTATTDPRELVKGTPYESAVSAACGRIASGRLGEDTHEPVGVVQAGGATRRLRVTWIGGQDGRLYLEMETVNAGVTKWQQIPDRRVIDAMMAKGATLVAE